MTNFDNTILGMSAGRAAREALVEGGRHPYILQNYLSVAHLLPKLLQRHGLGQTLACLQMRDPGAAQ